jgi:hypothetical protein
VAGWVEQTPVRAGIAGVLRGLLHDGVCVYPGMKIGDIDPRAAREHCFTISDKSLAIAGGVLEAVFYLLRGQPRAVPTALSADNGAPLAAERRNRRQAQNSEIPLDKRVHRRHPANGQSEALKG